MAVSLAEGVGPTTEELGRKVREVWVEWAKRQTDPKPSWLVEWDQLEDAQKEVDTLIGTTLFMMGYRAAFKNIEDSLSGMVRKL